MSKNKNPMPNYSTISDFRLLTSYFSTDELSGFIYRSASVPRPASSPPLRSAPLILLRRIAWLTRCPGFMPKRGSLSVLKYISAPAGRVNKKSEVSSEWRTYKYTVLSI